MGSVAKTAAFHALAPKKFAPAKLAAHTRSDWERGVRGTASVRAVHLQQCVFQLNVTVHHATPVAVVHSKHLQQQATHGPHILLWVETAQGCR